jgi:hypothetical protein
MFYARNWEQIFTYTKQIPIIKAKIEEIQEAAHQVMPENTLKAHAILYKEDIWCRQEINRAANMFVRTYLMNNIIH